MTGEEIEVASSGGHCFTVHVRGARGTTRHNVSVPPSLTDELGIGSSDEQRLVDASFRFLLEREPPTSILPTFGLDVIGHYFPDYLEAMRRRMRDP